MRFCCGGARVLTQVSGLSEFVLEKDDVLWQRLSGPQSDPGLRDGTRGDEPPSPETTVLLIVEQMLVAHEMVLDLLDLGAVETGAAVPSGLIGEIVRDVRDVAVVGSEVLVGGLGPLHVMRRIAGADRAAGLHEFAVRVLGRSVEMVGELFRPFVPRRGWLLRGIGARRGRRASRRRGRTW